MCGNVYELPEDTSTEDYECECGGTLVHNEMEDEKGGITNLITILETSKMTNKDGLTSGFIGIIITGLLIFFMGGNSPETGFGIVNFLPFIIGGLVIGFLLDKKHDLVNTAYLAAGVGFGCAAIAYIPMIISFLQTPNVHPVILLGRVSLISLIFRILLLLVIYGAIGGLFGGIGGAISSVIRGRKIGK